MAFTFTSCAQKSWNQLIQSGLHLEYKTLTGLNYDSKSHTLYATSSGEFVGGIIGEQYQTILWIDSIWVASSYRRQGVGKQLLSQTFDNAVSLKIKALQLNAYFDSAHKFFSSQGFETVTKIFNWKYGLPCYLMQRIL